MYWKRLLSAELSDENVSKNIRVYKIPHGVQGVVFIDVILSNKVFVPQALKIESANRDGK
jgi:hypothetical protein